MLLAFSFMVLFFGLFLLFPAYFLESSILFIVCLSMVVLGVLMLLARFFLLKRYSVKVEQFRAEAAEKIKCKYCGSMNPLDAERCIGCHAPL
jgi:ribosomal protein L40E